MQEEVTQKTIALVFKSSRLTADVLKKAMKMYLEHRKAGQQATHGKMSVKKLVGQGMGASSIEVSLYDGAKDKTRIKEQFEKSISNII